MRSLQPQPSFRERVLLLAAVTLVFVAAYFGASFLMWRAPIVLAWDPVRLIPCISAYVIPYSSAYFVPVLLLVVRMDRSDFRRLIAALAATIVLSVPWFVLWPLVPPHAMLGIGPFESVLSLIYRTDVNGNCFPSLHVSLAFLTAAGVGRSNPKWRGLLMGWATLVAISTVVVHQHYLIDVFGGMAYAAVVWKAFFRKPVSE